jgi:hypothetical protein
MNHRGMTSSNDNKGRRNQNSSIISQEASHPTHIYSQEASHPTHLQEGNALKNYELKQSNDDIQLSR